jgi:hypothetical protein
MTAPENHPAKQQRQNNRASKSLHDPPPLGFYFSDFALRNHHRSHTQEATASTKTATYIMSPLPALHKSGQQ